MGLSNTTLHEVADKLHRAEKERVPIESLSGEYKLSLEDAYSVQQINAGRAVRDGRRLVGYKIGLTSREAQKHFKVFEPDYGHLFDSFGILDGGKIELSTLIQPKIEGEIAFVLGRDLKGPGVTAVDAIQSIDCVMGAFEIIDSRIKDWKITAADTIADNGSSALFVLSAKKCSLRDLDLVHIGMALSRNGDVIITGAGGAVMGNPLNAVVFLANELGKQGQHLRAGEIILSGSLGGMLPIRPGDAFTCEFANLGRVSVRFGRNLQ